MGAQETYKLSGNLDAAVSRLSASAYELFERRAEAISSFASGSDTPFMELNRLPEIQNLGDTLIAENVGGRSALPDPYFELPNGGGWRVEPHGLGTNLVLKEWEEYALRARQLPPLNEYSQGVKRRLQSYLRTVRTGRSEAEQLVTIRGLELPADISKISMPLGAVYRNPNIPNFGIDAIPSSAYFMSSPHTTQLRVAHGADAPDGPDDRSLDHAFNIDLALARLAFYEGAGVKLYFGVREWRFPFCSYSRTAVNLAAALDYRPSIMTLNHENGEKVERAAERLRSAYDPTLGVAYVRLASALLDREDPADKLIDAVMVWECIFGSDTETVLRVTASMARLLEPDADKRMALLRSLKAIYTARSKLVHGAAGTVVNLYSMANDAVTYSQRALQSLVDMGSDFRGMQSTDRSLRLLSGAI